MSDPRVPSRAAVIEQRMQLLEMQAAIQRMTLAATFAHWEQRRTLDWVLSAAKMASGALASPPVKWLLTALLMRLIRRPRR